MFKLEIGELSRFKRVHSTAAVRVQDKVLEACIIECSFDAAICSA